jgi:hypothetical protein
LNVALVAAIVLLGILPAYFIDLAETACKNLVL